MDQQGEMFGDVTSAVSGVSADDKGDAASLANVQKVIRTIKRDKEHHEKAFKRMRRDMFIARLGYRPKDAGGVWDEDRYTANLSGRFVKQKVSGLYAKNPKAQARRRQTLDFTVWDENPDTLKQALGTVQQFQAMAAAPPAPPVPENPPPEATQMHAAADQMPGPVGEHLHAMAHGMTHAVNPPPAAPPTMGHNGGPPMPMQPPPEVQEAQSVVSDYQQGMQRRQQLAKFGRTLEILFQHFTEEQKPVSFKMGMKKMVRRACTTAVGYVELGVQREMGPRPGIVEQLADVRARLDHMQHLAQQRADGDFTDDDAEMAELRASVASLQAEPEIVLREGLIFDFPRSTKVIPDRLCQSLVGFEGARHLTIEYLYTPDEVEELFQVKLDGKFIGHDSAGRGDDGDEPSPNRVQDEDLGAMPTDKDGHGLVMVWKHYDKPSGLCYFVADGYDGFLREPAAPDVFVDDFWPVYALTFNDVESEDDLFPPSDVALMLSMQEEFNRAREGQREHRQAARPRATYAKGALDEEDVKNLGKAPAFSATAVNVAQGQNPAEVLSWMKIPGVDPNLYETAMFYEDTQMVVGTSQAGMGATSKATATGDAIAANASASADGSSVDDLDNLLSSVARGAGQILMREMSQEQVTRIAGPGAYWPQETVLDIADQIYLDVAAASTGKPNQAVEINNWKTMLPFLIQMPGISKDWLAKETIRRLDDDADLTEALAASVPSIVAQNRNMIQQAAAGPPPGAPGPQGGADNGPQPPPPTQGGSAPAFGSNQVHGAGA